jgi:hypothetical protein
MACDFTDKDENEGMSFDESSFLEYIKNPKTQYLIKNKLLLGTMSHKARSDFENETRRGNCAVGNPADYLIANDLASNCITDMQIKDHKLYITIETLPVSKGLILEKMLDLGIGLLVSMSTELTVRNGKYHIVNLFGLDHTTRPAFNTEVVEMKEVK